MYEGALFNQFISGAFCIIMNADMKKQQIKRIETRMIICCLFIWF